MKILFIHHAFPGQFLHLAPKLAELGHIVKALTEDKPVYPSPNVEVIKYKQGRKRTNGIHQWLNGTEEKYIRAEAVLSTCINLREQNFLPDVVYVHPDWGEALFIREAFPDAKIIIFAEHYYQLDKADAKFDTEFANESMYYHCGTKMNNAIRLMSINDSDLAICPTNFQKNNQPQAYHHKIKVIHDGIPTHKLVKNENIEIKLNEGVVLNRSNEVITFANRGLEPRRGFHQFMRVIPLLQKHNPNAHIIIMGKDVTVYGTYKELQAGSFKQHMIEEMGNNIDYSRVHFVDWLNYESFKAVIELSTVHVYLTAPFVLSWSMLEVMSVQGCIVGSKTAPVTEVIEDGVNGVLVDFFSPKDIANRVTELLNDQDKRDKMGKNARQTIVEKYDLETICLPRQIEIIENLVKNND
jgi:glycosyltransferase involved in cell wall biosynthesis